MNVQGRLMQVRFTQIHQVFEKKKSDTFLTECYEHWDSWWTSPTYGHQSLEASSIDNKISPEIFQLCTSLIIFNYIMFAKYPFVCIAWSIGVEVWLCLLWSELPLRINLPLFSAVVPFNICMFLSCRPFFVMTTLSTGLVGVEVTSVFTFKMIQLYRRSQSNIDENNKIVFRL